MEANLNRFSDNTLIIRLQDAFNITVPKYSNFQKVIRSKLICDAWASHVDDFECAIVKIRLSKIFHSNVI